MVLGVDFCVAGSGFFSESESESVSVDEVAAIEKKVEGGAIGLTFNSKLTTKMCGSNLNTSPMANPIGYVHVALLPLLKKKKRGISRLDNILNW